MSSLVLPQALEDMLHVQHLDTIEVDDKGPKFRQQKRKKKPTGETDSVAYQDKKNLKI